MTTSKPFMKLKEFVTSISVLLYVYTCFVTVTACPAIYTKIGCFRDDMRSPRPLPELKAKYSNIPIDWNNWDTYMTDLVCRCAKEAKVRNYAFFSIQYYGK